MYSMSQKLQHIGDNIFGTSKSNIPRILITK